MSNFQNDESEKILLKQRKRMMLVDLVIIFRATTISSVILTVALYKLTINSGRWAFSRRLSAFQLLISLTFLQDDKPARLHLKIVYEPSPSTIARTKDIGNSFKHRVTVPAQGACALEAAGANAIARRN